MLFREGIPVRKLEKSSLASVTAWKNITPDAVRIRDVPTVGGKNIGYLFSNTHSRCMVARSTQ